MGALDWLQDLIGGGGGGGGGMPMPPMQGLDDRASTPFPQGGDPMGGMGTPPLPPGTDPMTAGHKPPTPDPMATQPMPPVQGLDRPPPAPFPPGGDPMQAGPPPMPPGGDPMAGTGSGNNGGLPPSPAIPLPQPRPPGANGPGLPPNMPVPPPAQMRTDTPITRPNPNAPPLPPAVMAAQPPAPDSGPQARGILGRALGLDPNREAQIRGSLGAGLKAAGENAHKPGLAAFAGSMGSGVEGGKGADDKTTDQQDRFLQRKLAANTQANVSANSASTRDLNVARTQLALAQAKQAMAGGKESVVNSDQQLYLRAQSAAAQDGRLKVLKTAADQASTQFGPDSPQAKAAQKAHKEAYDATVEGHAKALGLDPGKVAKVGKMPGMSADNPIDPKKDKLTQDKLNALPPGTHVVGPDGKVLVKKGPPAPAAGGNQPATAQQQMTPSVPPTPPTPVTAPAGSLADDED